MAVLLNQTTTTPTGDRLILQALGAINLYNGAIPYTMAFWVRPIGLPASLFALFSISRDFDDLEYIGFDNSARYVLISNRNGQAQVSVVSPQFLVFSQWHYVAIVRSSATVCNMYVDGVAYALPAFNASTRAIQTNVEFGAALTSGEFPPTADFAYARLWFAALTAAELATEQNSTIPVKQTDLWSSWSLASVSLVEDGYGAASLPMTAQGTISTSTSPALLTPIGVPLLGSAGPSYTHALVSSGNLTISVPAPPTNENLNLIHQIGYSPVHIEVGVDAQRAEYKYRGAIATEIELSYSPRVQYSGLIWEQPVQDRIQIDAFGLRELIISPETPEGWKITPYVLNNFGVGGSVYSAIDQSEGNDVTSAVAFKIVQEGQRIHIWWYNSTGSSVLVAASLLGTGYYVKEPQTILVVDDDLVAYNRGRHTAIKVDLKMVSSEEEAQKVGNSLLELLKRQIDNIFTLEYVFGSTPRDTARMQKILGIEIGSTITVTEAQSGVDRMLHLVVGENMAFSAGQLTVTHTLISLSTS